MYNPESMTYDEKVVVNIGRFTELVRSEERLSVIEKMIRGGKYTTIEDIKNVLDIKEVNKENKTE